MGTSLIKLNKPVSLISAASVVGSKEHEGPFGSCFDLFDKDDSFGKKTWEESEGEMQKLALNLALSKAGYSPDMLDALFAGDLINQCTPSALGLLPFDVPYFGLYGACSTAVLGLLLSSLLIDGGHYKRCAAVTSSHNCTSERQFRFPIEYGAQRTPTAQWTATAAGAFILEDGDAPPFIREVMPGRTIDRGIDDANNMGAAMAPAALDTLLRYFDESRSSPGDFDKIVTGDLGEQGYEILCELAQKEGFPINSVCTDCGLIIYDREKQDTHAGGSGCGCSASMLAGHFIRELRSGRLSDILFIGTGALLSQMSVGQGESIPGIAHLVRITREAQ